MKRGTKVKIDFRVPREVAGFYGRVAQAAGTDLNTVMVVVIALYVTGESARLKAAGLPVPKARRSR